MTALLKVQHLETYYGHIHALKGIDIEVRPGQLVTIIGANGSGKTTTMKTLIGVIKPKRGKIVYDSLDITGLSPHLIVARGMVLVPEGRAILTRMTVLENLQMGAFVRKDESVGADLEKMLNRFPILRQRWDQKAGTLSGGQQQMLAIARGLMARPKLLLLDEPSMGLAPMVVSEVIDIIREIRNSGVSVLLVEQNVRQALAISDYTYVLETGKVILQGNSDVLINDPRVKDSYLGGDRPYNG
ncbi:MAG: ABC transporter ATP-binding protein [Nitrospirae bacterium]|nr:ABC transporter ATP-binding protein [Nitrospirota bacterium]